MALLDPSTQSDWNPVQPWPRCIHCGGRCGFKCDACSRPICLEHAELKGKFGELCRSKDCIERRSHE